TSGGPSTITYIATTGCLLVRTSEPIHRELMRTLSSLRAGKKVAEAYAEQSDLVPRIKTAAPKAKPEAPVFSGFGGGFGGGGASGLFFGPATPKPTADPEEESAKPITDSKSTEYEKSSDQ